MHSGWFSCSPSSSLDPSVAGLLGDSIAHVFRTLLNTPTLECSLPSVAHGSGSPIVEGEILAFMPMRQGRHPLLHERCEQPTALFCLAMDERDLARFLPPSTSPSTTLRADVLSALTNMTFGALKTYLNAHGYTYLPNLPTTLSVAEARVKFANQAWLSLSCAIGDMSPHFHFCDDRTDVPE